MYPLYSVSSRSFPLYPLLPSLSNPYFPTSPQTKGMKTVTKYGGIDAAAKKFGIDLRKF